MISASPVALVLDLAGTLAFAINARSPRSDVAERLGIGELVAAAAGAGVCFLVRMLGLGLGLNAPYPPGAAPGAEDHGPER